MKRFERTISLRGRYAAWGALLAMHAVFVIAMGAVFVPARTAAQQSPAMASDATCYVEAECKRNLADPSKPAETDFEIGDATGEKNGCVEPQGKCFARSTPISLAVNIGDKPYVLDIGDYIASVYRYAVGIAAIIAAIMMMIGGFQYLTAGGDAGRVSAGKQRIIDALVGLGLTLGAFTLLNTINPDLVRLRLPKVELVKRQIFTGCKATELCFPCGAKYGVIMVPGAPAQAGQGAARPESPQQGDCQYDSKTATKLGKEPSTTPNVTIDLNAENVMATCIGRGCFFLGGEACRDDRFNCAAEQGELPPESQCGEIGVGANVKYADIKANDRYMCRPCTADGQSCTGRGRNAACCGGFCADAFGTTDVCTAGAPGDTCDDPSECASGICQTNWGNSCSLGEVGSPCAENSECKPGYKCSTDGNNICTPGLTYNTCDENSECQSGNCDTDGVNICLPSGTAKQFNCAEGRNSWCVGGWCADPSNVHDPICTDGRAGAPCGANEECDLPRRQADQTQTWGSEGLCVDDKVCSNGWVGSKCNGDWDCEFGHCYTAGDFGTCVTGNLGSRCDNNADCNTDKGFTCRTGQDFGKETYRGPFGVRELPIEGRCLQTAAPAP